jgi:hypothetical protein
MLGARLLQLIALYHLTRGYEAEAAIARRLHAPSRLSA